MLLHSGNQYASVPLAHLTTLNEQHEAIKYILEKYSYDKHKWSTSCLVNSLGLPNTHVFYASGIVGTELTIM